MFLKNKYIIFKIRRSKVTDYAALRTPPTHTAHILLQKLNCVKIVNILVFIKTAKVFVSCVKISGKYLGYYTNYSLFNLKGAKSKVTKIEIWSQGCMLVIFCNKKCLKLTV